MCVSQFIYTQYTIGEVEVVRGTVSRTLLDCHSFALHIRFDYGSLIVLFVKYNGHCASGHLRRSLSV